MSSIPNGGGQPTGPQVPKNFKQPEPRIAYVRQDAALSILGGTVGSLLRAGSGSLIAGYKFKMEKGKLVEYSDSLPRVRPTKPLVLYEFEACPFCRRVREAISMLDIDVLVKPCPKGSTIYRKYVENTFGKQQFPYLQDPNTGFEGYESAEIIKYLFKTYGPIDTRVPLALGSLGTITAGFASVASMRRGAIREPRVVSAPKPLELWAYEASPFCKIVRERLCELELAYILHTTPRGSPSREALKELTGRVQIPYLVDPNTGVSMFESADICEYLTQTYGPEAPGATATPIASDTDDLSDTVVTPASKTVSGTGQSLNPEEAIDPKLDEYCKDEPDADECRTYES